MYLFKQKNLVLKEILSIYPSEKLWENINIFMDYFLPTLLNEKYLYQIYLVYFFFIKN